MTKQLEMTNGYRKAKKTFANDTVIDKLNELKDMLCDGKEGYADMEEFVDNLINDLQKGDK